MKIEWGTEKNMGTCSRTVAGRRGGDTSSTSLFRLGAKLAKSTFQQADDKTGNMHTAAKQHVIIRALQMQGGVGGSADAAVSEPGYLCRQR